MGKREDFIGVLSVDDVHLMGHMVASVIRDAGGHTPAYVVDSLDLLTDRVVVANDDHITETFEFALRLLVVHDPEFAYWLAMTDQMTAAALDKDSVVDDVIDRARVPVV